jgi:hypothetical protein
MMQHRRVRYIGLDVHRATIAVAIAEEEGAPTSYGTIVNDPAAVRKLVRQLGGKEFDLRVAYRPNRSVGIRAGNADGGQSAPTGRRQRH